MKGAIVLVRRNVSLLVEIDQVRADLGLQLRHMDDYSLQLSDSGGHLLTAFSPTLPASEWDDVLVASAGQDLRPGQMSGHSVECRWEDLFCLVVGELAARVETWVVDGDEALWPGGFIDPGRLRL